MQIQPLPKRPRSRVSLIRAFLLYALVATSASFLRGEDAQKPSEQPDASAAQPKNAIANSANPSAAQDDHAFLEQVEKAAARTEPPPTIPGTDREPPSAPVPASRETLPPADIEQPRPPSSVALEEKGSASQSRKESPHPKNEERHPKPLKREKHTEIAKSAPALDPVLEPPQGSAVSRDLFVPRRKPEAPAVRDPNPLNGPPMPAGTTVTTVTTQFKAADGRTIVSTKKTTTIPRSPKPDARALLRPFFETYHPGPGN
jgi:hypothetical protein